MLGQLPPLLRLRRNNEIQNVSGQKAECAVIVLVPSFEIATGFHRLAAYGQAAFTHPGRKTPRLILAMAKQSRLDGVFEGFFRNNGTHNATREVIVAFGSS